MSAALIDGKAIAAQTRAQVARDVAALKAAHSITPGLAVVLVGRDAASEVYVRSKERAVGEAGMNSYPHHLPETTTEPELLALIDRLNVDARVHGILVQLPLPRGLNADAVLQRIDPAKDIDGFHPLNAGRLATGQPALTPCTPMGCMVLLKHTLGDLAGKHAVVIGRSNIVGKPMAALLLGADCTVTVAHSRTKNLDGIVRQADIVVAAVGRPEFVRGDWIKRGATIIDVGINRVAGENGKTRLVGDVEFVEAAKAAAAITPVPGGVGPMTIACLLQNTLQAARDQAEK